MSSLSMTLGNLWYSGRELTNNSITITQEQLLATNATDDEGDELTASNLQTNDPDATIVANDDGCNSAIHAYQN